MKYLIFFFFVAFYCRSIAAQSLDSLLSYSKELANQERYAEADYTLNLVEKGDSIGCRLASSYLFHGSVFEALLNKDRAVECYVKSLKTLYQMNQSGQKLYEDSQAVYDEGIAKLYDLYCYEEIGKLESQYPPIVFVSKSIGTSTEISEIILKKVLRLTIAGDYEECENLLDLEIKPLNMKLYAGFMRELAGFYRLTEDEKSAMRCLRKASECSDNMMLRAEKKEQEQQVMYHRALARQLSETSRRNLLDAWYNTYKADSLFIRHAIQELPLMTDDERLQYWIKQKESYHWVYSFFKDMERNNLLEDHMISHLLDYSLFQQGLLLNTERFSRKSIVESAELTQLQAKHLKLKAQVVRQKLDRMSAIYQETDLLGREISIKKLQYGAKLCYNWEEIQQELSINEAAILFSSYHAKNSLGYYDAFIILPGNKAPIHIDLGLNRGYLGNLSKEGSFLDEEMADSTFVNNIYGDSFYYQAIWRLISWKLRRNTTIYYSLTDQMNLLSTDALLLSDDDDTRLMDKYSLHRLSSLNELVTIKREKHLKLRQVELFGDIRYYGAPTVLSDTIRHHRGIIRSDKLQPLPYSLYEIQELKTLFDKHLITSYIHTGRKADERTVKKLSGQSPQVLHFSTHAFFIDRQNPQSFSLDSPEIEKRKDDIAYNARNCGLFLSGSGSVWNRQRNLIFDDDDGILTGEEISLLDLSATELVILSACDTGLGVIDACEGVYGLQRAFKQAGVKTILMSLWKVDDKATSELIVSFYRKWVDGKDKRVAFKEAQQEMRTKYKAPYYWAAFVMLD